MYMKFSSESWFKRYNLKKHKPQFEDQEQAYALIGKPKTSFQGSEEYAN